jgi:hypothetical protein
MRSPAQWAVQEPSVGLFWGAPPYLGAAGLAAVIAIALLRRASPGRRAWISSTVVLVCQAMAQTVPFVVLARENLKPELWAFLGLKGAGLVGAGFFWVRSRARAGWSMIDQLTAAYASLALTSMAMFIFTDDLFRDRSTLGPGAYGFAAAVLTFVVSSVLDARPDAKPSMVGQT